MAKFLDFNGLSYTWGKIKTYVTTLLGDKVDKTTSVNGHALSGNVTVTKSDVSLGNVTNDAQVKRSEMGVAHGVATLGSDKYVLESQLSDVALGGLVKAYADSSQTSLSNEWLRTGSNPQTSDLVPHRDSLVYCLMEASGIYRQYSLFIWRAGTFVEIPTGGDSSDMTPITNSEIDSLIV